MRPIDSDEVAHLDAVRASVLAGFTFIHIAEPDGSAVAAIVAQREHDGAVDTYAVQGTDEAVAARYRASDFHDPTSDPVWAATGDVATVVRALLDLPAHGPGAPLRTTRLPSDFWLPGRTR